MFLSELCPNNGLFGHFVRIMLSILILLLEFHKNHCIFVKSNLLAYVSQKNAIFVKN